MITPWYADQSLMDCFSHACKGFELTISLKTTNVLGHDTEATPVIAIDGYGLVAVCQFTYLGSTITDNISLDAEIDKRIWEGRLDSRSSHGSSADKSQAVCADKYGSLQCLCYQHILYGSETWTTHARPEGRLNTFHSRTIRRILGISLQDKVTNADVLSRAGRPTMYTLFRQRRLRWLGHVCRMEDGRIPKYILYGELALGRRTTGRPHPRYKDVCVRDLKAVDIDTMSWECRAADRTKWRIALKQHLKTGEDKLMAAAADKRAPRKEGRSSIRPEPHIDVMSAIKTAIPTLVFSTIYISKRRCYNPARN